MSLGELGNNAVKAVDDVIKNMEIPNKNPSESATGKGDLGSWRDVRDKIDDFQKTSPFENVSDATAKPLADSPLGKMSEGETLDKPMGEQDKPLEIKQENIEQDKNAEGGSYSELKKQEGREGKEVHHMPADSASSLERNDGPAIIMEKEDHQDTASYGASKEAREYRATQKELIDNGKFREAFEMDVKDIQDKFGDKYDKSIKEARTYVDKLESEGKV